MMKNTIIILLLLCFMPTVQSQSKTFGIEAALSTNFISFSSSNEMPQKLKIEKRLGGHFGGNLTFKYNKFSVRNKLGFQFNRFNYLPGFIYTDVNGMPQSLSDKSVINSLVLLTSAITYDSEAGFYFGTGISLTYLINSKVRTYGQSVQSQLQEGGWIRNYQYRDLGIYIPFVMGFEWRANAIFVNYFWGLTNKNMQAFSIAENERIINLGYRYTIPQ